MNDDPREVLAILNSLGFIGITAQQLKAFMKDLKLYRKIKEHERQQRKEEIKKKIMDKQQSMIKEILREHKTHNYSIENTISTNSSSSYVDNSLVKINIKCSSNDKENEKSNSEENFAVTKQKLNIMKSKPEFKEVFDHYNIKSNSVSSHKNDVPRLQSKTTYLKGLEKDVCTKKQHQTKAESDKITRHEKSVPLQSIRPMSAPNILEHEQEHFGSSRTKIIRPWRLQPEVRKALSIKKSDPVTMYQKYQQEWKQMSFPGEAKHSSVRWAIREKMLGGDPHPMPVPKKSTSMPMLKRK
nr:PREDICTED: hydrolethalus syndrome protein 1 homolog isoform X2 [Megachile rotundata]